MGKGCEQEGIRAGDEFTFGGVLLTVRHTLGHTPEHASLVLAEKDKDFPGGVLTGDSPLVVSAGRPDSLGEGTVEELLTLLRETGYNCHNEAGAPSFV